MAEINKISIRTTLNSTEYAIFDLLFSDPATEQTSSLILRKIAKLQPFLRQ